MCYKSRMGPFLIITQATIIFWQGYYNSLLSLCPHSWTSAVYSTQNSQKKIFMSGILQSSAQDPIMASPPRAKAKVHKSILIALHSPNDLHLPCLISCTSLAYLPTMSNLCALAGMHTQFHLQSFALYFLHQEHSPPW